MDFDVQKEDRNIYACVSDYENSLLVYDQRSDKPVHQLVDYHSATPTSCRFTKGNKIVTAGVDGLLQVFDMTSKQVVLKVQENNVISTLNSDPYEQRYCLTTNFDKTVNIYDLSTGAYRHLPKDDMHFEHTGCIGC